MKYKSPSGSYERLSRIFLTRSLRNGEGDVSLLCDDGVSVSVHSSMLAGASDMMARVLSEHVQCPHRDQVTISVPGLDSDIVKSMVELLYTALAL